MVEVSKIFQNIRTAFSPSFRGEAVQTGVDSKSIEPNKPQLSNVTNDSGVKTPMPYTYVGELNALEGLKGKVYRLQNGQKVVILPKRGQTIVKTYVNVGSMNEPDELRGISHFIEHNLFNGTKKLGAGEFFKKVTEMGASTNASTSFATTDYYISSQLLKKGDLEEKISIHADMLQNPAFPPDMIDKERGPVISEIGMIMDDAQNISVNAAIKNLFQIQTTSPDLIAGTVKNIQNVTRDDVINYYNTHYTSDNFTTVITGEVNPEETIALVSKYFTKEAPKTPSVKKYEDLNITDSPKRIDYESQKTTASNVSVAFAGPENNNARGKVATDVITMLLAGHSGARITKPFEKLGISPEMQVERVGNRPSDPKVIIVGTKTPPDKREEALNTIYQGISDLQTNGVSEEELNMVKTKINATIEDFGENSYMLNNIIGTSYLDFDSTYLTKYKDILKSLTPEDIKSYAKSYLNLDKASVATVNPSAKGVLPQKSISFGSSAKEVNYTQKTAYDVSKLKETTLSNNIAMVTNPVSRDIVVGTLKLKVQAPAGVKPGVQELMEQLLYRGSMSKDNETFDKIADEKGIEINFDADANTMAMFVKSNAENSKLALQLAKEAMLTPRFKQEDFEIVKKQLLTAAKNQKPTASDDLMATLFPNFPFYATKENFIKSLENITLEDVMGLHKYIMQNAQAQFVLSAPNDTHPEIAQNAVEMLEGGFPKFKEFKPEITQTFTQGSSKTLVKTDERNQADVCRAYKFKTNQNREDQIKFELLNIILGGTPNSRLFMDLREKRKLAYRVNSSVNYLGNSGIFKLNIKTTTDSPAEGNKVLDNIKKSLNGFDENIKKITTQKVSDQELESAKLYLKNCILDGMETTQGLTCELSRNKSSQYGLNLTNETLKVIDEISADDIQAAASYIFSEPCVTSIVASQKTLDHYKTKK